MCSLKEREAVAKRFINVKVSWIRKPLCTKQVLVAPRDTSLQEGSCGKQERMVSLTAEAGEEWLVSVTDVFTTGDSHMSGPHHVSGELELTKERALTAGVWAKSQLLLVHWETNYVWRDQTIDFWSREGKIGAALGKWTTRPDARMWMMGFTLWHWIWGSCL